MAAAVTLSSNNKIPAPAEIGEILETFDTAQAGERAYRLAEALFPICRSITGDGLRQSLKLLQKTAPLEVQEVPSGTRAFDWIVPNEWNIRDAFIRNARGLRVVDFKQNNLHVLNYSAPVHRKMTLAELRPHLFTSPSLPDAIPYRTSYYNEAWGFCLAQRQLDALVEGDYEVCIDSALAPGSLSYGEYSLTGQSEEEVLISTHACHPSLANDNLSGMTVAVLVADALKHARRRFSYRFIWVPGTIGAIAWLSRNEPMLHKVRHGLVLSCLGDRGGFTYKRSRHGNAEIDRAAEHVLRTSDGASRALDFSPYGYDERQYCSPGINLPMGCLMRTPHGCYPEYHTSADNLSLITPESLGEAVRRILAIIEVLEDNASYVNLNPKCEPQLGRRGLYGATGGAIDPAAMQMAMLWTLNFSDGGHDLLSIAQRSGLPFSQLNRATRLLMDSGLLRRRDTSV